MVVDRNARLTSVSTAAYTNFGIDRSGGACDGGNLNATCAVPEARSAVRRRPAPAAFAIAMAVAAVAGQVYLVSAHRFLNLVETPFLAYSLAGSFAIHFWTRPARTERLITLAVAAAAAAVFVFGS